MDRLVVYADNPGADAPYLYAAERVYHRWCQNHNLQAVRIGRMEVDPTARTYRIYAIDGHALPPGEPEDSIHGSMDKLLEEMAG